MKLDTRAFRYLSQEDWRVLTAVEHGSKNHEVVPTSLINQLSSLRTGLNGCQKSISTLAKSNLVARVQNAKYDGYRLTYGGYDYLALRTLTRNGSILHLGSQMGVGKESDIYLVTSPSKPSTSSPTTNNHNTDSHSLPPRQSILKIHRLGRTSFRSIRNNRSYHGSREHCSWQYLSRLSATKEYAAMRALHAAGFPVPEPIAQNRHTIVMSLVPGLPLRQVPRTLFHGGVEEVARVYGELMELLLRLASVGLIHGDFNEFNILLCNLPEPEDRQDEQTSVDSDSLPPTPLLTDSPNTKSLPIAPHLIDFPQITSLAHPQAEWYFCRDVECIKTFFRKRYHFTATRTPKADFTKGNDKGEDTRQHEVENEEEHGPTFADAQQRLADTLKAGTPARLDVAIEAAGFSRKMARELERYYEAQREDRRGAVRGEESFEEVANDRNFVDMTDLRESLDKDEERSNGHGESSANSTSGGGSRKDSDHIVNQLKIDAVWTNLELGTVRGETLNEAQTQESLPENDIGKDTVMELGDENDMESVEIPFQQQESSASSPTRNSHTASVTLSAKARAGWSI